MILSSFKSLLTIGLDNYRVIIAICNIEEYTVNASFYYVINSLIYDHILKLFLPK